MKYKSEDYKISAVKYYNEMRCKNYPLLFYF